LSCKLRYLAQTHQLRQNFKTTELDAGYFQAYLYIAAAHLALGEPEQAQKWCLRHRCSILASGPMSALVVNLTDGIDDSARIVELDVLGAIGQEKLLCI
jgi:hypothetical protein